MNKTRSELIREYDEKSPSAIRAEAHADRMVARMTGDFYYRCEGCRQSFMEVDEEECPDCPKCGDEMTCRPVLR